MTQKPHSAKEKMERSELKTSTHEERMTSDQRAGRHCPEEGQAET